MTGAAVHELIGLYVGREPVFFDEGCLPSFREWDRWADAHWNLPVKFLVGRNRLEHINVRLKLPKP